MNSSNNIYNYIKKISYIFMIIGFIIMFIEIYKSYFIINNEHVNTIIKNNIENLLNKYHNRPWAALYTTAFYFIGISLGTLFFLAIQYISQAGWSVILIRVMEAIITFFPYGGMFIFIILLLNSLGIIKMFHWMDNSLYNKYSIHYDEIIFYKHYFFNKSFYIIRSVIYITVWTIFIFYFKLLSKKLDQTNNIKYQNKLYNISVIFIFVFSITFIIMAWDWIMCLDPHWMSTLFSWYVLSGFLVTGISTITIVSIFLKKNGFLSKFNNNHLHDLAKYIFASSMLWSYLWGAQFLLYWYSNIPEEVVYFVERSELYKNIHLWMIIPNLLIPFFGLISSKSKRNYKIVLLVSFSVMSGHYINTYNMIIPSTVGLFYGFGMSEIGSILIMTGLFIYIIQHILKKSYLIPKGNKFLRESELFEYPY